MNNPVPVYEIRFLGWEGCQWLYCFSRHRSIPWWSWFGYECTCYVALYAFIEQTQCLISFQEGQQGILLLAFFEAKIRQFHVTQYLAPEDVLGEAILRGVKFIEKQGEPIHSPTAWLRKTGYNVVRETYRRHRQERSLDDRIELRAPEPEPTEPDERLAGLNQALIHLPEGDQRMLIWHYVQEYSWREIASRVNSTEMAVRQRGHRAKSRLLKALKG